MIVNSNLVNAKLERLSKTAIDALDASVSKSRVLYDATGSVIRCSDGTRFKNTSDLELRTSAQLATDSKYLGATRYDSTNNTQVVWNGSAWIPTNSTLPTLAQLDMDFFSTIATSHQKIQSITFIGRPILLMPSKSIGGLSANFGPYIDIAATGGFGSGTISIKYKISIIIDGTNYNQFWRSMSGYVNSADTDRNIMFDIPTTIIESSAGTKNVNVLFEMVEAYVGGVAIPTSQLTHACVGSMKFIQL